MKKKKSLNATPFEKYKPLMSQSLPKLILFGKVLQLTGHGWSPFSSSIST